MEDWRSKMEVASRRFFVRRWPEEEAALQKEHDRSVTRCGARFIGLTKRKAPRSCMHGALRTERPTLGQNRLSGLRSAVEIQEA